MHGSFISFTKCMLKTYVLLETFSEVTALSGVIVLLAGVASCSGSICVKCIGIEVASTEGIYSGSICIGTTSIGDTGGTFIKAAGIGSTGTKDLYSNSAYIKSTCVGGTSIVK